MFRRKLLWIVVIICLAFLIFVSARSKNFSNIAKFFYNTEACGYSRMKLQEALEVASYGECSEKGKTFFWGASCNSYTGTWWLGYLSDEATKCNPSCVVNTSSKQSEINYMCVGGINYK